jgi:uncharacterized membrane protein AbrB (regulator of aidB expression)
VVGVDAAVAGQASLEQVVHALGDALEMVVPVAMLGMLGLAVTELRDPESALPRWANGLAAAVLGIGVAATAALDFGNVAAADAYWPLFFVPVVWLVAFGASIVRQAGKAPEATAPARATFAVQER